MVPCPLCSQRGEFRHVRNLRRADHFIAKVYGPGLYGEAIRSEWRVCIRCGFVHQNPRPSIANLNRFYLEGGYHKDPIPAEWSILSNFMHFANFYYGDKLDWMRSVTGMAAGHAFDVGFGHGGAMRLLLDRGWTVDGREPDEDLVAFARATLGVKEARPGLVDSAIVVEKKAELVLSNHTFEHLADLHETMRGITRIVKPGGFVLTVVPTFYRNRSDMSLQWMNASHYSMFTHHSLNQLGAYHGFEPVAHTYRGSRKYVDEVWHIARYTGKKLAPEQFFENPKRVERYIAIQNPINSVIGYPIYHDYHKKYPGYRRAYDFVTTLHHWPGRIMRFARRKLVALTSNKPR
jgi:SAM-dependent methyltransferase